MPNNLFTVEGNSEFGFWVGIPRYLDGFKDTSSQS